MDIYYNLLKVGRNILLLSNNIDDTCKGVFLAQLRRPYVTIYKFNGNVALAKKNLYYKVIAQITPKRPLLDSLPLYFHCDPPTAYGHYRVLARLAEEGAHVYSILSHETIIRK